VFGPTDGLAVWPASAHESIATKNAGVLLQAHSLCSHGTDEEEDGEEMPPGLIGDGEEMPELVGCASHPGVYLAAP